MLKSLGLDTQGRPVSVRLCGLTACHTTITFAIHPGNSDVERAVQEYKKRRRTLPVSYRATCDISHQSIYLSLHIEAAFVALFMVDLDTNSEESMGRSAMQASYHTTIGKGYNGHLYDQRNAHSPHP